MSSLRSLNAVVLAFLLPFALGGCAVAIVGGLAGAGAAGYAAGQERGVNGDVSDFLTKNHVETALAGAKPALPADIDVDVYDGRALLTGTASTPEAKARAGVLASRAAGVKAVYNNIIVAPAETAWQSAKDAWITTRLRSDLTFDGSIRSLNYSIETVDGSVYLMGSARDQGELERATAWARNIPGVKRVVSYVEIRPGAPVTAQAEAPAPVTAAPGNADAVPATPVQVQKL